VKEIRQIRSGVFAKVEVCKVCEKGTYSLGSQESGTNLFQRKAFKIGGSLAIRIPMEMVNTLGIKEGSELDLVLDKKGILISPNGKHTKKR
jgi:hypothetical protein